MFVKKSSILDMSKQNKAEKNLAYKEKEKMNMGNKLSLREFAEVFSLAGVLI